MSASEYDVRLQEEKKFWWEVLQWNKKYEEKNKLQDKKKRLSFYNLNGSLDSPWSSPSKKRS